jgi:hypothetical protein
MSGVNAKMKCHAWVTDRFAVHHNVNVAAPTGALLDVSNINKCRRSALNRGAADCAFASKRRVTVIAQ